MLNRRRHHTFRQKIPPDILLPGKMYRHMLELPLILTLTLGPLRSYLPGWHTYGTWMKDAWQTPMVTATEILPTANILIIYDWPPDLGVPERIAENNSASWLMLATSTSPQTLPRAHGGRNPRASPRAQVLAPATLALGIVLQDGRLTPVGPHMAENTPMPLRAHTSNLL